MRFKKLRPPNVLTVTTIEPVLSQAEKEATTLCSCLNELDGPDDPLKDVPLPDMLFFTKIMKTATSTLQNVHRLLSMRNKYSLWDIEPPRYRGKNATRIALEILMPSCPRLVNSHHRFIDFTASGFRNPTYVSMVREPLERIQSYFHFDRTVMKFTHSEEKLKQWEGKSFEYCLKSGDPDCDLPGCVQTAFFCGFGPECNKCDQPMLNLAMQHIEKFYPVVGLVEQMNITVAVLEKMNPAFYSGAYEAFVKDLEEYTANRGTQYETASSSVMTDQTVRARYAVEYELYNFISKRLYAQYEKLKSIS